MRYTIVCVVNGYADTFSVQLDETETVHDLEIAIQAVHKGVDIDLHYPLLYLMNLNASNWVEEMKLRTQDLGQLVPLDRFEQLKDVFHSSSPHLRTVHILVQPSKGESCTGAELDAMLMPLSHKAPSFTNLIRSRSKTVQERNQ